jgi:hypothetical protein
MGPGLTPVAPSPFLPTAGAAPPGAWCPARRATSVAPHFPTRIPCTHTHTHAQARPRPRLLFLPPRRSPKCLPLHPPGRPRPACLHSPCNRFRRFAHPPDSPHTHLSPRLPPLRTQTRPRPLPSVPYLWALPAPRLGRAPTHPFPVGLAPRGLRPSLPPPPASPAPPPCLGPRRPLPPPRPCAPYFPLHALLPCTGSVARPLF